MAKALEETALISAMIFAIIVGGYLFARFLAVTGTTQAMVEILVGMDLGRVLFLVTLVGLFIILGAMLDVFGMLVLTIPFVMYGIFRYLYLVHRKGQGANPTTLVLRDVPLIVNVLMWAGMVVVVLYLL